MSVGFEGLLLVENKPVLCTGASVPYRRTIIESNSGYSGVILPDDPTKGVGRPRTYGFPENVGSFNFDGNISWIEELIDWIYNRKVNKRIDIKPSGSSLQRFDETYWTGITLSANEGAVVNGSVDFFAVERTQETISADYINNRIGTMYNYWTETLPLNPSAYNENPIPFWKTWLNSSSPYLMSWSLNLTQEVQPYFTCHNTTNPEKPSYIGIGIMTGTIQLEYYVDSTIVITETIPSMDLHIGNYNVFKMRQLELQERNQDIQDQNTPVNIILNYNIYALSI